ncbi:MAG: flippase [Chitinophagales bacterium]
MLKSYLAKGLSASFLIQLSAIAIGFGSSWLLAKLIGATGYGVYTYAFSWVTILSGMAWLGFDDLLIRDVAVYRSQGKTNLLKGLLQTALAGTVIAAIVLTLLAYGGIELFAYLQYLFDFPFEVSFLSDSSTKTALQIAFIAILPMTLLLVLQFALVGAKEIVLGQIAEKLFKPIFFLLAVIGIYFYQDQHITPIEVITANVVVVFAACVLAYFFFRKKLIQPYQKIQASYQQKIWWSTAISFALVNTLNLVYIKADIVMLGTITGAESVGVYSIASKFSELLRFFLAIVYLVVSPMIADMYAAGKLKELQALATKSARGVLLLSLPMVVVFWLFGEWILGLFGLEFVAGYDVLIILCIGQLFNLACGIGGNLLMMTGHEKATFWGLFLSTIVNISFNALLIPSMGMMGAAIATVLGVVVWNIILLVLVRQKLGIDASILGIKI